MSKNMVLTTDEQLEVVKRIAWFWRDMDIQKYVKNVFGKDITQRGICAYKSYDKWKTYIENFREKFINEFTEVACANKRVRLEELQRHYNHYIDQGDIEASLGVLKMFREEMEKKVGDINIQTNNFTQINQTAYSKMSDSELASEINKTLKQLERSGKGVIDGMGSKDAQKAIEEGKETKEEGLHHE